MGGLDKLLATRLNEVIKNNLGEKTSEKIEQRLFEKYGVSLTQAIEDFNKVDAVLREFFGAGADGLEKRFLDNICSTKAKSKNNSWYTIQDPEISHKILESYGDEDKNKILAAVQIDSKIISEVLSESKIPQTSGYRKINALIDDGLLVADGYNVSSDGRRVTRYRSLFENIRINIVKNKMTVDVQMGSNYAQSTVLMTISA